MENEERSDEQLFENDLLDYDVSVTGFDGDYGDNLQIKLVAKAKSVPACLVISLEGYIDTYNYKFFQKQVMYVMLRGFSKVIFDCEKLEYLSSSGIGSFPVLLNSVKDMDGAIVLLKPQSQVYGVFEILGFSRFFPKMDSLEEAIAFLSKPKSDTPEEIFPKVLSCPACSKKLRVTHEGRFRCTECQAIISVDKDGKVES